MQSINLTPQLKDQIKEQFTLLESHNPKRKIDSLSLRVSGYADVMYLISDIVKVCILALGDGENHGNRNIPEPSSNISGVLGIILDLIPYEEIDLLDRLREAVLNETEITEVEADDFILETIFLTPPSNN